MNDEEAAPRKKGRPAGKRGTFSFRVTAELRAKLEAAAAASERPVSEEIERRLEDTFTAEVVSQAAASAVEAATERLAIAKRASLETIFSTLEEFEALIGGKDACSFAAHVGQSVAHHVAGDAKGSPSAGPWWEDDARREAIRAKLVKSVGGLVDNWDFVQKSSMIPSVGWIIEKRIAENIASGEYERRHERALLEADAAPKKD